MAITFNAFNGKNPYFDYDSFEKSISTSLPSTCRSAQVYLFNNFPIEVSTELSADFVLVLAIENADGNYVQFLNGENKVYLHNLIIPVKIVTEFKQSQIALVDEVLMSGEAPIDYTEELPTLGYGLRDYLAGKCKFDREGLFVHPLIFIINNNRLISKNHLTYEKFGFDAIMYYLKNCQGNIFISYKAWKTPSGFKLIEQDVKRMVEQASLDSKTGYITQKKIARISKGVSDEKEIFELLGKRLMIIEGKAGTGKTSEILLLMMRCVDAGQNTMFLTFNKLLVYDISKTIKAYTSQRVLSTDDKRGTHGVITLHKFMHKLSRSIGLLHLMSDNRLKEITEVLFLRSETISRFLKDFCVVNKVSLLDYKNLNLLKTSIQQSNLELGLKEVGMDVANFINKERLNDPKDIDNTIGTFIKYKRDLLAGIEGDKIFLTDYYEVLKEILLAINNPGGYFKKYNIANKFQLLETLMNLSKKHMDEEGKQINEEKFISNVKTRFARRRHKRILFVDEAQDCHPREREILISIFGIKNVIVSSGGYEQLIRHVELCRWNFFKGRRLIGSPNVNRAKRKFQFQDLSQFSMFSPDDVETKDVIELDTSVQDEEVVWFKKGRKSFRVKKAILDFCNYLGNECHLSLGLQALQSEDVGEVIFDFRSLPSDDMVSIEINKLIRHAELNGCTQYEGLLMLIDANSKIISSDFSHGDGISQTTGRPTAAINEYSNIEESVSKPKKQWKYKAKLNEDILIWDGAVDDKNEIGIPSPSEIRLLYYESCRGLEAWNVACFNLDRFFENKLEHPDAEKFLIETERESGMQKLEVTNEMRKMMFAGTWTLMAMTRAMDKIYISIDNRNSIFGKIVLNYIKTNPQNVKVII